MAVLKEIVAITGTYKDKEGKEKSSYLTIGRIIETKNGEMIKMDSFPVGWDGWAYLNDPKPRNGSSSGESSKTDNSKAKSADSFEDDIPF